jgi:UDPglucose 6-dehydrogenase
MDISKFKIGIIGKGCVGSAVLRGLCEHVAEVRVYDSQPERRTHTLEETLNTDLAFVCLPTPPLKTGTCNLFSLYWLTDQLINAAASQLPAVLILKSTMPVGTTEQMVKRLRTANVHLPVCCSPEFLTARTATIDFHTPSRIIVGTPYDNESRDVVRSLVLPFFTARFAGVNLLTMSANEAEFVKLAANAFFATKLAFFNELYEYSGRAGLRWTAIREGILSDGRIAHSHTQVPGPDGKLGYGGECLPKDIANLAACFRDVGCPTDLLDVVQTRNRNQRCGDVS